MKYDPDLNHVTLFGKSPETWLQMERELEELRARNARVAAQLPRVTVEAAPQGGFMCIGEPKDPGYMRMPLSAHSTLDEALDFVRRTMG